jgi:hypothetical protein
MMWKIIWEKEKSKPLLNILYLYLIIIFAANILEPTESDYVVGGLIFFYILMVVSTLGPFSLMWFISSNNDSSLSNPSYCGLDKNLKMLSISYIEFTKYNVIYGLIKTVPFLILVIVLGGNTSSYIIYFTFASIVLIILIPLNTFITHNVRNIALDNRQENRKTIISKIKSYYKSTYPLYNSNITYYLNKFIPIMLILMLIGLNGLLFNNSGNQFYLITSTVMAIVGTFSVVTIGLYQFRMVLKSENEV